MTQGLEAVTCQEWLYGALSGDSALTAAAPGGVWDGSAPEGGEFAIPTDTDEVFVTFFAQSPGIEIRGTGTATIGVNSLWTVAAVQAASGIDSLVIPATRIYNLLHGKQNVATTHGAILVCTREQVLNRGSTVGGREYRRLGGIFRILAQ